MLPASLASPQRGSQGARSSGGGAPVAGAVQILLLGGGRAAAKTAYNEAFIALLKSLPEVQGALRWNAGDRLWEFPAAAAPSVVKAVKEQLSDMEVEQPPRAVLKLITQHAGTDEAAVQERLDTLPAGVWGRLLPFQRDGVRRGVAAGGRCLLGDDMGLGKTVQAICIAACYPEDWPLLVVCPSSLRLQWADALLSWAPPDVLPPPEHIAIVAAAKDIGKKLTASWRRQRRRVLIISYDLVKKLPEDVSSQFGVVVADESHALKTPTAQRTQAVAPLVKAAKRAILITGTPALSRPIELYPQLDMLTRGGLGALSTFGKRYCDPQASHFGYGMQYSGSANVEELHAVLEAVGMIRRLKQDVLQDLPPKRRTRVTILPDPSHIRDLEGIKRAMQTVAEDSSLRPDEADRRRQLLLNQLYGASGDAKAAPAAEHVNMLLGKGLKLLVFAHHAAVLDAIQAACSKSSRAVRIDGSTAPTVRQQAVDEFQNSRGCRLALLSITAAGVGITLTAAEAVVFAELVWTPAQLIQAEDRAHRLGQSGSLEVHYLHAPGSIDDIMWPNIRAKLNVVGSTLDGHLTGTATGLDITQFGSWAPRPQPDGAAAAAAAAAADADAAKAAAIGAAGGSQATQDHSRQQQQQQQQQQPPAGNQAGWGSQPLQGSQPSPSGTPAGLSDIDLTPIEDSDDDVRPGDSVLPTLTGTPCGSQPQRSQRQRAPGIQHGGAGASQQQPEQQQSQHSQRQAAQLSRIDLTPLDGSDDDVRPGDAYVPETAAAAAGAATDGGGGGGGGAGCSAGGDQGSRGSRHALNAAADGGRAGSPAGAAPPQGSELNPATGAARGRKRRRPPGGSDVVDLT